MVKCETTYNFEVEDFHTYYVGPGVLVHNKNCKTLSNDKILEDIINNPESIQNYSLDEFKSLATNSSWETGPLTRSSQGAVGFKAVGPVDGQMISWHPSGSKYHFDGMAYWKVSSGRKGTIRFKYLG